MLLSKRLRELRITHGISQGELGKTLSVTKQTVSNWENDNIQPSIEMLVKIADYFNITNDYLLGRSDQEMLNVSGLSPSEKAHIDHIINDIKNLHNDQTFPIKSLTQKCCGSPEKLNKKN